MEKAGQVVMPGEVIGKVDPAKTTKIGIGVIQNQENLIATKCGILRSKGNHVWVDNRQKRVRTPLQDHNLVISPCSKLSPSQYVPVMEDMVLGVVLEKHVENAKVDLGSAVPAVLPMLAFEGATRKNRPNLQVRSPASVRLVAPRACTKERCSFIDQHAECTSPATAGGNGRVCESRGGEQGHGARAGVHSGDGQGRGIRHSRGRLHGEVLT